MRSDLRYLAKAALLLLTSLVLAGAAAPAGLLCWLHGMIRFGHRIRRLGELLYTTAYLHDVGAAAWYRDFFDTMFLRPGGRKFGQDKESISSCLGRNWVTGHLTHLGMGCVGFLNCLDTDHCWKYIEGPRPPGPKPPPVGPLPVAGFLLLVLACAWLAVLAYRVGLPCI